MATILLVGRTQEVLREATAHVNVAGVEFEYATTLAEVESALRASTVADLIMGGGLSTETRLAVFDLVLRTSDTTTMHSKGRGTGPEGFEPFLRAIVGSLHAAPAGV